MIKTFVTTSLNVSQFAISSGFFGFNQSDESFVGREVGRNIKDLKKSLDGLKILL